ncbi:hypothetical protein [Poseidonibacter lekithochrous]|uniref:hypothetical protein n=1 Tax=Poseidonibacter lekithochrous TaxID=1904463 RepID=UPI000D38C10E|nr:hypothetical protein [Poseidonibacter lekithochrous]
MEQFSLLLIFWYGILHAFAPDHLTAIADFSIGKNKSKTVLITVLFAFGHGVSLLVFAKILQNFNVSAEILGYGDIISAAVIFGMGIYLLFLVSTNRINIKKHQHDGKEHIHIFFGKDHTHKKTDVTSALTIGTLMGIGGVRGMLVTLGAIENSAVDIFMVFAFTFGVSIIFIGFGAFILYVNKNLLNTKKNITRIFTGVGAISVMVGLNMLLS